MIRPEALTRLRLLVGAARPPVVAGELDRELPPLQPGQAVDGRVEQQTRAGFIVAVNGRIFEIKLPDGTRTGDLLRMVYVNGNPRPTFALLRVEHGVTQPESRLSDTGKLLAMLQEEPVEKAGELSTRESVPIFTARLPETTQAASLLREMLASSGLFYESHQAQWVLGTRTTAQLQREPQGRLPPLPPRPDQPQAQPPAHAAPTAAPDDEHDPLLARPAIGQDPETAGNTGAAPRIAVDPEAYPIVRQQLSTLESGHVEWRGMVWPGQAMEWKVSEGWGDVDDRDADAADREGLPRRWCTELRLTLPKLGKVVARIQLDATGARLALVADSGQHANRLRAEATALAARFGASGIPVHALEVADARETA